MKKMSSEESNKGAASSKGVKFADESDLNGSLASFADDLSQYPSTLNQSAIESLQGQIGSDMYVNGF